MFNSIQTSRFFNLGTQRALYERVEGYVDKDPHTSHLLDGEPLDNRVKNWLRMDLGQNPDGCDPLLLEYAANSFSSTRGMGYCKDYPNLNWDPLLNRIARLYQIPPEWILLSAGLDQMLSLIAATFFELNDRYIITDPTFFLFDEYSKRMGANAIRLSLRVEEDFDWSPRVFNDYASVLDKLHPKMVWIANPNNPTGRNLELEQVEEIVKIAEDHYTFVVVDEAYGEYIDPDGGTKSAASLLGRFQNLIVLRTFSKAYGLANLRVAYAMASDRGVLDALQLHRPYYPITGLSFDMACLALDRHDYLKTVRTRQQTRFSQIKREVSRFSGYRLVESCTGTFIIAHKDMQALQFRKALLSRGIVSSRVPGEGPSARDFIRITIGRPEDNEVLLRVLKEIE